MARLDDQRNFLWKRLVERYPFAGFSCSLETNDGGMFGVLWDYDNHYVVDGEIAVPPDSIVRLDAEGNVLWCNPYPQLLLPGPEPRKVNVTALLPAPDGGVLVIGQNWDVDGLKFLRLDGNGAVLADWRLEIGIPIDYAEAFTAGGQGYLV